MNIADKILQNQDRDGMLRRSLERIIQLYTDKSHFVYELLQNAEDAGATGIRFVQYSDRLEVMHDGKSFTTENLQGLCDIGQSDKVNDLNQIGEFGVGFKSVFGICETVRLYSSPRKKELAENCHPFAVEIKDFTKPVDIPAVDVPAGYTTLFVFPYSVGFQFSGFKNLAALNEAITKRLKNLGVTTLLFMRHLELIEYEIKIPGKEASGEYLLDAEPINDHCTRVSAIESEDDKTDESLSFIKFSMPIDSRVSTRTIDVAFTVATDKEGKTTFQKAKNPYISVYFPTETESKLDFIVQGPFRTTPNRSSVPADEEENEALAEQTAKLLRQSVLELRDMGLLDLSLIRILPLDEDDFDVYPLFYPLYEEMRDLFSSERVLPVKDGKGYTTQGKSYRGNIEGSDPRCSFHWVGTSDRLYVFEAPIDLLAFLTLYPDGWQQHSYVALCGTAEHAMLWMLEKNPNLRKTILCLDHDAAGIEAVGRLSDVLREHGYSQIAPLQSEYKDWDEDLKARHGLEAQPAEEHPQFVAADLVCQRIGTRCKEVQPDRAAYQIPGLLLQYRNDLHWGRFDQAMEHMETMAALSLSVVLRECKQMGTALTVEQGVRFLESHILPHQNRSILKNRADEIAMQFQSVLAKNNRQGIRTQAEKKEVASAWLELAISCAKVPVKYEADEIKRRQKEEKTQRETEPVMA